MEENLQSEQTPVSTETQVSETKKCCGKCKKFFTVKMAVIVAIVLVIAGLAFAFRSLAFAAKVNGHFISRFEVISTLEKQSGKEALSFLISQRLVEDEINNKGIKVTDDEVNAEVKKYEDSLKANGTTLEADLAQQKITLAELKKQMSLNLGLEKLLGDKILVTDDEAAKAIKDSGQDIPKGQEAQALAYVKGQLKQQKGSVAMQALLAELEVKSNITHFVSY
jgi:hypothetical protein